ncbi:MAG: CDP-diacylglycerol--serine O-phosphatidyltransferase [Candidatus Marinimicrobia bacterium]|nr:CDP-diacylglycerol--serine O-phosphatidyltransferase [Candidatus Neomarinimicrobiota bacterium]
MRKPRRKFIPSIFTVFNLFFGFLAIINIYQEKYVSVFLLVILAGVFDFLDGKVARWLNQETEFGVELDSLSDIISFCAVPALLINHLFMDELGFIGNAISFFPLLFGAFRLARYNVLANGKPIKFFTGMPVPSSAMSINAIIWFNLNLNGTPGNPKIILPYIIMISFLMVSNIRFPKPPGICFGRDKKKNLASIFTLASLAGTFIFGGIVLFPVMGFYIITALLSWIAGYEEDSELIAD